MSHTVLVVRVEVTDIHVASQSSRQVGKETDHPTREGHRADRWAKETRGRDDACSHALGVNNDRQVTSFGEQVICFSSLCSFHPQPPKASRQVSQVSRQHLLYARHIDYKIHTHTHLRTYVYIHTHK